MLHEDRLFPVDPNSRAIARRLYESVRGLPIVSPHGHTDPRWFAENLPFADPAQLFVTPDHYVFRMLYSQGVPLENLGVPRADGGPVETDPRRVWRLFAEHYRLFAGTPTRLWLDHAFETLFGLEERLCAANADRHYDLIADALQRPDFRPRALFETFNIEVLATTESPLDDLRWHRMIRDSDWRGRVITTYRPDSVVDPHFPGFRDNVARLGAIADEDTATWSGYLEAHRKRRVFFKAHGATATDHGHPSAATADLAPAAAQALFARIVSSEVADGDAELFRAQMLTEMAAMSLEDGLVMQIHPGSFRNHNPRLYQRFGRDKGADIPTATDYVRALKPLLDRFGNERALTIILSRWMKPPIRANLRPSPAIIPRCGWGRPGGSSIPSPACAVSVILRPRPPASPIRSASTTTRAPFPRSPPAMTWRDGSIVRRWRNSSRRISSRRTKRANWRMTSPIAWRKRRIDWEAGGRLSAAAWKCRRSVV